MSPRRLTMLVFHDKGAEGIERLAVVPLGHGRPLLERSWELEKVDQWTRLAQIVDERNPRGSGSTRPRRSTTAMVCRPRFGRRWSRPCGPDLTSSPVFSAERLACGWLERRSSDEMEVYPHVMAIAHGIIAEAFSRRVITPGVTTTDDVVWWFRERTRSWPDQLVPALDRHPATERRTPTARARLSTRAMCSTATSGSSTSASARIPSRWLTSSGKAKPMRRAGLKQAMAKGNRLQDIHLDEMKAGRTGNDVLASALKRAKDGASSQASIPTRWAGHGHAAGAIIGLWDKQGGVPGLGDFPLLPRHRLLDRAQRPDSGFPSGAARK